MRIAVKVKVKLSVTPGRHFASCICPSCGKRLVYLSERCTRCGQELSWEPIVKRRRMYEV